MQPGSRFFKMLTQSVRNSIFFLQILITPRKKTKNFCKKKKNNVKVGRNQKMILI